MIRQIPVIKRLTILKDDAFRFQNAILKRITLSLRNQSVNIIRVWSRQCEFVLAQRIRRSHQTLALWGEHTFKTFVRQVWNRKRTFVLGAMAISTTSYNWEKEGIADEEMLSHLDELDYVKILSKHTVCNVCDGQKKCECQHERICDCESKNGAVKKNSFDGWTVFVEKKDLIVWRRMNTAAGHYEYKVYGSYHDVSAEDFLNVQIDTQYRLQWDKTAVRLEVVEHDSKPSTNSDVLYWEMLWPRLFANRDYVFIRRFMVDRLRKRALLVNKGTVHPKCPEYDTTHRITDYWSFMVIQPYTELNKPGIEFSLTYFDNPGVNIPSSVTNWVAVRAMPDFLERLRIATTQYKTYCKQAGVQCAFKIDSSPLESTLDFLDEDDQLVNERPRQKRLSYNFFDRDMVTDNTIFEAQINLRRRKHAGDIDTCDVLIPKDNTPNDATSQNSSQEQEKLGDLKDYPLDDEELLIAFGIFDDSKTCREGNNLEWSEQWADETDDKLEPSELESPPTGIFKFLHSSFYFS